jgi:hypothetical protein
MHLQVVERPGPALAYPYVPEAPGVNASDTTLWLGRSRNGYCAKTCATPDPQLQRHACNRADKGSFELPSEERSSWERAASACLSRCSTCPRCRYVSISRDFGDCSWFHTCDMSQLLTDVASFRSASSAKVGAWALPREPTRPRWRAAAPAADDDHGLAPLPLQSLGHAPPPFIALGIMSAPALRGRRQASRRTWLRAVSPALQIRFLIRSLSLAEDAGGGRPKAVQAAIRHEQQASTRALIAH